jgi:CRISPR-associated endonuclease/helicase Cas3
MNELFYAHSKSGEPLERWQPLEDHLTRVAGMARFSPNKSGAGGWGYLAGLWIDLGKCSVSSTERTARSV